MGVKMYTCKICGKQLQTKSALFNHIRKYKITKDEYISKYDSSLLPKYKKCKMCNNEVLITKTYCSQQCKYNDSELNAKRIRKTKNDSNKRLKCKICGKLIRDILNQGGHAKRHLFKYHNISCDNYMEYYTIETAPKKDLFNCPLCNWTVSDLNNSSGWFTSHLKNKHNLTISEFIGKYPNYKYLWSYYIANEERKDLFKNEESYVICKVCNKKFKMLSNTHLELHGLTSQQYRKKYGSLISPLTSKRLSESWHENLGKYEPDVKSKAEIEIVQFLTDIGIVNIETGNRKILAGFELDIYLPDYKVAIEYNGVYWHSFKDKTYHIDKTNKCEELNIHLIQIFEDEWKFKNELVKIKLKHILKHNSEDKIYARKCIIKEISLKEKCQFLKQYHIQGNDKSQIKLGLFYLNELVAVMTFGMGRKALGSKSKNDIYELVRFASKYNIIGGASKLLKYFIKTWRPKLIISYADRRWTYSKDNVYEKIGFTKISAGSPNYWYVVNDKRLHRFNFTKHVIINKLGGLPYLTEMENMINLGYRVIWDCGSLKYELKP